MFYYRQQSISDRLFSCVHHNKALGNVFIFGICDFEKKKIKKKKKTKHQSKITQWTNSLFSRFYIHLIADISFVVCKIIHNHFNCLYFPSMKERQFFLLLQDMCPVHTAN